MKREVKIMKGQRFIDKPPYYFDYYYVLKSKGIWLICPDCNHLAILLKTEKGLICTCQTCFKTEKIDKHADKLYFYRYTGLCHCCKKYIRCDLEEIEYPTITEACRNCGEMNQLKIQKNEPVTYQYKKISFLESGLDPLTGKQLYFLDAYKGNIFWALNLEHLNYLIAYVEAELRQRDERTRVSKSAGHVLPKFMKVSKNRKNILHKLNKMKQNTF